MNESSADRQRVQYMRSQREGAARLHNSSRRSYEQLRSSIRSGGIIDDFVEPELIASFGATRNSLRRSLQMLAEDGLLIRRRRVGTALSGDILEFPTVASAEAVSAPEPAAADQWPTAAAPLTAEVTVLELSQRLVTTPALMKHRLQIDADLILIHEQLGLFRDQPLFHRVGYMPLTTPSSATGFAAAPASDQAAHEAAGPAAPGTAAPDSGPAAGRRALRPIADTFQELFGEPFGRSSASIEAVPCEGGTADLLGIEPGSPMLLRELVLRDRSGRPREYSFTHFRGDRVALTSLSGTNVRLID